VTSLLKSASILPTLNATVPLDVAKAVDLAAAFARTGRVLLLSAPIARTSGCWCLSDRHHCMEDHNKLNAGGGMDAEAQSETIRLAQEWTPVVQKLGQVLRILEGGHNATGHKALV
jgi:hypothetical protein